MVLEIIVYYTESLVFEITKGAFLFHPLSMTNDGEYLLLRFSFRMIFVVVDMIALIGSLTGVTFVGVIMHICAML